MPRGFEKTDLDALPQVQDILIGHDLIDLNPVKLQIERLGFFAQSCLDNHPFIHGGDELDRLFHGEDPLGVSRRQNPHLGKFSFQIRHGAAMIEMRMGYDQISNT